MLSDHELMSVQAATERITSPVTVLVAEGPSGDAFATNLVNTARQISGVSMNRVILEFAADAPMPDKSSLTLSKSGSGKIHYFAALDDRELVPFLDALTWLGGSEPPSSAALEELKNLATPVDILVLIAPVCPHCPQAVRLALSFAVKQPLITLRIVDAIQFGEIAEEYKVKSTPTTIVNGARTLVGTLSESDLLRSILESDNESALTDTLDSMIKSGRAEDAGKLICQKKAAPAVLPIYLAKEFSTRMGALVAMEEALEIDPRSLDSIVYDLIPLLSQDDVALRGDTAELLGKIGNRAAEPALRQAAQDDDPDVRDAAAEALEALGSSEDEI